MAGDDADNSITITQAPIGIKPAHGGQGSGPGRLAKQARPTGKVAHRDEDVCVGHGDADAACVAHQRQR